jgi:hypothetical protein
LFFKTPKEGAQTTIYLASSDEVSNVSGKYFIDSKEVIPKSYITLPEKCLALWNESIKLAKIQPDDPVI